MKHSKGQSLLEVLMVAGLMGVLMVILVGVSTTSINRNQQAENRTVATRLAQEGVEWIRSERDRVGWLQLDKNMREEMNASLTGEWCLSKVSLQVGVSGFNDCNVENMNGVFKRNVIFNKANINDDSYNIIVEVTWGDGEEVSVRTELFKKDI